MKKIVIVGGGFAGVSALKIFLRAKSNLELILLDRKNTFDFLPALPDVIGERFKPDFLRFDLPNFCKRIGVRFINQEVKSIDFNRQTLGFDSQELSYDYLLLASGTQTNFYGNEKIGKQAYKLDSVSDAENILKAIRSNTFDTFIIVGGGYTGIEVATNIKRYSLRNGKKVKIIIIEKAPELLSALPVWMKHYTKTNITTLGIEVLLNTSVVDIDNGNVKLSDGQRFNSALLVWTAGVKAGEYIFKADSEKTLQGRLKVDRYLRINERCFAAGDTAAFFKNDTSLRMAVQFSLSEGIIAAQNILKSIQKKELIPYKPKDLGYIVPMANNKSCGLILGLKVKGFLATIFHYFMCIYRSYGLKNRLGLIINLLKGGV